MAEEKEAKGKKSRKKHESKKKGLYYEAKENSLDRKKRYCPKCGPGIFLAEHSDRYSCGKCSYTEWKKR